MGSDPLGRGRPRTRGDSPAAQAARDRANACADEWAEWLYVYKMLRGCSVCGYAESPAALDLHHRDPATKRFTVGGNCWSWGWEAREAELEKCDVICANCHRRLHAKELDLEACAPTDTASTPPQPATLPRSPGARVPQGTARR